MAEPQNVCNFLNHASFCESRVLPKSKTFNMFLSDTCRSPIKKYLTHESPVESPQKQMAESISETNFYIKCRRLHVNCSVRPNVSSIPRCSMKYSMQRPKYSFVRSLQTRQHLRRENSDERRTQLSFPPAQRLLPAAFFSPEYSPRAPIIVHSRRKKISTNKSK